LLKPHIYTVTVKEIIGSKVYVIGQANIRIGDEITRFDAMVAAAALSQNTWVAGGGFVGVTGWSDFS